jgi:anthranilate synthase component 1
MDKQTRIPSTHQQLTEPEAPLVRVLPADLETPVSIYLKLADAHSPSFLLESVTGGEQVARYSFIGVGACRMYCLQGESQIIREANGERRVRAGDPFQLLEEEFLARRRPVIPGLTRFSGGLVGYLGYEAVRWFEPGVASLPAPRGIADGLFLEADCVVAFDHAFGKVILISHPDPDLSQPHRQQQARQRLDDLQNRLAQPLPLQSSAPATNGLPKTEWQKPPREAFLQAVERAKQAIQAGEIFQVVLSQCFTRPTSAHPFEIYRTLRRLNPSPYMFYLDFADWSEEQPLRLIGASPEMHVRLTGRTAIIRPIAGTRPRGLTDLQDIEMEKDLLADPKERAEHIMLVDLARNDLGRVCAFGSVRVSEQMNIERYSHVMHIVSQVEGRLRPEMNAFGLMRATFPAGTVSGAPKVQAMQLIAGLEERSRGVYAGAGG